LLVAFTFLQKKKREKKRKYWIHKVFRAREDLEEFQTLFGRLNDDRQQLLKYFRMSYLKLETAVAQTLRR